MAEIEVGDGVRHILQVIVKRSEERVEPRVVILGPCLRHDDLRQRCASMRDQTVLARGRWCSWIAREPQDVFGDSRQLKRQAARIGVVGKQKVEGGGEPWLRVVLRR